MASDRQALARAASSLLARRRDEGLASGTRRAQPRLGVGEQRKSALSPKEPLNLPSKSLRSEQKTSRQAKPGPQPPAKPPPAALLRKQQVQALRQQRAPPGPKQPDVPPPKKLVQARAPQPKKLAQASAPQAKRPRLTIDSMHGRSGSFPENIPMRISFPNEYEAPDLLDECSADALAIRIEGRKKGLCLETDAVLANHFDDEDADIQYSEGNTQKDDSWELFPGVGAALQATVSGTTDLFCVAASRRHGIWGVGVSNSGRCRYQASRIALALALCERSSEEGESMDLTEHSAFAALYAQIESGNSVTSRLPTQAARQNQDSRQRKTFSGTNSQSKVPQAPSTFPKDTPVWLSLEDLPKPELLADFPDEALALSSDGKTKGMYTKADAVLAHVLGGSVDDDDVELLDDPDWTKLPEIGTALDAFAEKQECFCVALSHSHNVWALGLGMRGQARFSAAKVALAASIYMKTCDGTEELDLSDFAAFEEFLGAIRHS